MLAIRSIEGNIGDRSADTFRADLHNESARALLRVLVKRVLRRYGYPPDKQEQATQTVLEQAEVPSGAWAVEASA